MQDSHPFSCQAIDLCRYNYLVEYIPQKRLFLHPDRKYQFMSRKTRGASYASPDRVTLDNLIGRDLRVIFFFNRDTALAAGVHGPGGEQTFFCEC